jgi:hypothetical protein
MSKRSALTELSVLFLRLGAILSILAVVFPGYGATTRMGGEIAANDQLVRNFYLAIEDYYRIPEPEILGLVEQGLSYEELPVAFFIAERSKTETHRVMEMRQAGKTWTEIAFRLGLMPDVFYVPVGTPVTSLPFGHAYNSYSRKPKREWKTVSLTEKDVVNLVNLRFLSDDYGCPPERVIEMRAAGKTFMEINEALRKASNIRGRDNQS